VISGVEDVEEVKQHPRICKIDLLKDWKAEAVLFIPSVVSNVRH
jgi:hypothetical protein